jgi:ankyrin repeat protein
MALTPVSAKRKTFQDFELVVTHKDPVQANRANLHVADAYASGFGVDQSLPTFRRIVQKRANEGLQIAKAIAEIVNGSCRLLFHENSDDCDAFYTRRLVRELLPIPKLESMPHEICYESLEIAACRAAQALGTSVIPASIFAVHYKVTQQSPCGAPVNQRNTTTGETALVTAHRLGDFQATIDLLDRGVVASIRDYSGCLPLHWLCMFEELVALRLTQDWGLQYIDCKSSRPTVPDVQFPLVLHGTALSFAVATCSTQAVKTLLALGANPTCGSTKMMPSGEIDLQSRLHSVFTLSIYLACFCRRCTEIGTVFCSLLCWPPCLRTAEIIDDRNLAASLDLTGVVTVLLEHGSLSKIDGVSQTALHAAAGKGHQGPLMAIIQSGQDLDPRDLEDYTPLQLAIKSHSHRGSHAYSCTVALLEAGADPNAHARNLTWPIHTAFRHSRGQARLDLVRKLHEYGARLDVRRSDGTTLLHLAAYMGNSLMVEYLLNNGITPTALSNRGQTPLHDCVRSRPIEQNEQYSRADLEAICRIIKMLGNAGGQAPFKPFAREVPISERMQYSELVPGADGTLESRNIKARMGRFLKKRQEERAEQSKKKQMESANKVHGHGVALFRDGTHRTPFELAALKGSDREVLGCLLEIHGEAMVRQSRNPQVQKTYDLELTTTPSDSFRNHRLVIDTGWKAAVESENWLAVKQFLLQEAPVDLHLLRWPASARLFDYSITRNDTDLLQLFMGDASASIRSRILSTLPISLPLRSRAE